MIWFKKNGEKFKLKINLLMIIGIFLRHIKAYKGIKYIPIGEKHNFVAFTGENGVGKSSILQGLDSFFNEKNYFINKGSVGEGTKDINFPYFVPIFFIPKDKIKGKSEEIVKELSDFFWNVEKTNLSPGVIGTTKDFFELREKIKDKKDSHYLLVIGEKILNTAQTYFGSFHRDLELMKKFDININDAEISKTDIDEYEKELDDHLQKNYKNLLKEIRDIYSYVYIPVEIDVQDFTKIEQTEMQKIFDKEIKAEIEKMISSKDINDINDKLNAFTDEIVSILDNKYFYDTGNRGKKSLTPRDLVEKILETYFQIRVLNKGKIGDKNAKKISELSSGEKRQALIDLICAFLKKGDEREKSLIIGIDEPENSLHTSICYDQFEKLKKVSDKNQILITTHWYGFLPVISEGVVHFLKNEEQSISFLPEIDLSDIEYKTNNNPQDFTLKSTNDLVQSIFYSLKAEKPYNWLICEGKSDKAYLDYFFEKEINHNNLRIIAVGGASLVKKFYKYLELPIEENIKNLKKGKVFCLTDTDSDTDKLNILNQKNNHFNKILKIQRLAKNQEIFTTLINFETQEKQAPINIEQSLNPTIFRETLESLNAEPKFLIWEIQDNDGNTTQENLTNIHINNYFRNVNKNDFARKYTEIIKSKQNSESYIPNWIKEIKNFFND